MEGLEEIKQNLEIQLEETEAVCSMFMEDEFEVFILKL